MNKEEFIDELKQTRQQIESCLADKYEDYFVGEFSRKDLEILSRALLIAIQVTDFDMKGRYVMNKWNKCEDVMPPLDEEGKL